MSDVRRRVNAGGPSRNRLLDSDADCGGNVSASGNASGWLVVLVLLLAGGAGAAFWIRAEGTPPEVQAPESLLMGRKGTTLSLALADPGSGLRDLRVTLERSTGEKVLLEEHYPGNLLSGGVRVRHKVELPITADDVKDLRGRAMLRIAVRDWSWRGPLTGNETLRELPLTVDLEPPRVSVESGLTYVTQGGAGAVDYRVSEPTATDGVRVGDHFYRGYPRPGGGDGERVALFAVPSDAPADVTPVVVARDAAGNEASEGWPVVVKAREMPRGNITLPPSFLEHVVSRLSKDGAGDVAAFQDVNTRLRAEDEAKIRKLLGEHSEPTPLFDGRLEQLANSKVTSRFAERRTYFYEGKEVSKAVHYGYDLAATAATPVDAAAGARVVYAGDLGIYGNCVLLDHGLGLSSLYGHLSRIDVKPGDRVAQGDQIGLSGATGLAGGDHLHFAVLVGDTYVDPLEWWDPKWVQTHVTERLSQPAS